MVSPSSGPTAGGTVVTITGTNLNGATAVAFGGTAATNVVVLSATQVLATAPAGSVGTVDVTVTTPYGTSPTSTADQFTYVALPTVTGISPPSGSTNGGTTVTISGTNFTGLTAVAFGGVYAAALTVNSATQITATSPPQAAGTMDVVVTNSAGSSGTSAADQFTFVAPVPAVTGVGPSSGSTTGGTAVTVWGSGFTDATQVWFGGVASAFTVISDTEISATSPESAAVGVVDVQVSTQYGGTSPVVPEDQYTYTLPPAPVVSGVSPSSGTAAGGTSVTISGSALTGATAVSFDGLAAPSFVVNSDTSITVTAPAGLVPGTVDVTVTTPSGTSSTSSADWYTMVGSANQFLVTNPAGTAAVWTSGPVLINTNTTVSLAQHLVLFDANTSGAAVTLTLPAAAQAGAGFIVWLRRSAGSNTLQFAAQSGDTVDGSATLAVPNAVGSCLGIQCEGGTTWVSFLDRNPGGLQGPQTVTTTDAGTTNVSYPLTSYHATTGTPAAGFGAGYLFQGDTNGAPQQDLADLVASLQAPGSGNYKSQVSLRAYDAAGARTGLTVGTTGSAPTIGFLGATPIGAQASPDVGTLLGNLGLTSGSNLNTLNAGVLKVGLLLSVLPSS